VTHPRAIRNQLHAVNLLNGLINIRLPDTINALTARLNQHDGYPSTASGSDSGPRGTSELTPTEAAAHRRLGDAESLHGFKYKPGPTATLYDIDELLGILHRAATQLLDICDTRGPRPTTTIPTCDGRGIEGFDQWGEACDRTADKAGMCAMHYQRCYRWRRDHGLKPLRDTETVAA
jgi:hypothetical protein